MGALKLIKEVSEEENQLIEIIEEIKIARDRAYFDATIQNVETLVSWYNVLLAKVESKLEKKVYKNSCNNVKSIK